MENLASAQALALASERFLNWTPSWAVKGLTPGPAGEKHFTPQELATLWGLSVDTIRTLFADEPDVLKYGEKNPNGKQRYITLRIPESVAARLHKRLSA